MGDLVPETRLECPVEGKCPLPANPSISSPHSGLQTGSKGEQVEQDRTLVEIGRPVSNLSTFLCGFDRFGDRDLAGITSRLSYLADLGIDAIWISPFFLSPMKDFGYDVEDHRQVDPLFGSNEDFDALLEQAHSLGIRVLIDLVLSHCSENHPWFQDCLKGKGSPHDEAFIWVDPGPDGEPPNNWISIFGGPAWTFHEGRGQYYLHNFLVSQPDLNYHSPKVRQEALSIARYWLDKGVDGFRLDAINFCLHDPELGTIQWPRLRMDKCTTLQSLRDLASCLRQEPPGCSPVSGRIAGGHG